MSTYKQRFRRIRFVNHIDDNRKEVEEYYNTKPKVNGYTIYWMDDNKKIWKELFNTVSREYIESPNPKNTDTLEYLSDMLDFIYHYYTSNVVYSKNGKEKNISIRHYVENDDSPIMEFLKLGSLVRLVRTSDEFNFEPVIDLDLDDDLDQSYFGFSSQKKQLVAEIKALKKEVKKKLGKNWIDRNKSMWLRNFKEAKRLDDLEELKTLKQMLKFILYYYDTNVSLIKYPYEDDNVNFEELGRIDEYVEIYSGGLVMGFAALRRLAENPLYDVLLNADVVSGFGFY